MAYESMGQYLNLVGTDFRISLSFSRHVTSKFAKTPYLQEAIYFLAEMTVTPARVYFYLNHFLLFNHSTELLSFEDCVPSEEWPSIE